MRLAKKHDAQWERWKKGAEKEATRLLRKSSWIFTALFCRNLKGALCMPSHFSHVWLFAVSRTVACQAPLSMVFSRQELWSGLLCPSPSHKVWPPIFFFQINRLGRRRQEYWGGLPFSPPGESSWLRDQTHVSYVSCIGGPFFTTSATGKPKGPPRTFI